MSFFKRSEPPTVAMELAYKGQFYVNEVKPYLPTAADLSEISNIEGIDLASYVLYQSFRNSETFAAEIEAIDRFHGEPSNASPLKAYLMAADSLVGGPNFSRQFVKLCNLLEDAGYEVVPIWKEHGQSITSMSLKLAQVIKGELFEPGILVTFGRASLAARMFLEKRKEDPQVQEHLKGWILFSGSFKGSPEYQRNLRKPWLAALLKMKASLYGYSFNGIMEEAEGYPLWQPSFLMSSDFYILSVFGMPRSADVPMDYFSHFRALSQHGPNDGLNLTTSAIPRKGYVYPIWGVPYDLNFKGAHEFFKKVLVFASQRVHERAHTPKTHGSFEDLPSPK